MFGFGQSGGQPLTSTTSTAPTFGSSFGGGGTTFGVPSSTSSTTSGFGGGGNFSFGTGNPSVSTAQVAPTGGGAFSFGAPTASTAPAGGSGFSFGTPTASVSTAQVAPTVPTFGSSFGAPTSTASTLGFQAPTSFGLGTSQAQGQPQQPLTSTSTAPTFGSSFSFGISTAPSTSTTSAAPTFGSSFLSTSTTSTAPTFGTSFLSGSTLGTSTGAPTTTTTFQPPSSFGGLGGVHSSMTGDISLGAGFSGAKLEGRAVKELPVPPELLQIVEDLKNHMKNHKVKMTEIGRASDKSIDKVVEEIEGSRLAVANLSNLVQRQILFCKTLMKDIQEEMKNVDMAILTRDTPLVLQNEITAPTNYFYTLINCYQDRMINYRREIERAETALFSLVDSQGFSSKDLLIALKGTKGTVMALAAKVQELHEQVVSEIMTHRNLKRFAMDERGPGWSGGSKISVPSRQGSHSGHQNDTVIPQSVNANYHRVYDRVNAIFNSPQRGNDSSVYRPVSSTPMYSSPGGYSGAPQLFQTASSTILGSPGVTGGLKRSKR